MIFKTVASGETTVFAQISLFVPISASNVKKLIKDKEVKLNGQRISADAPVKIGDEIEIFVPQAFIAAEPQNLQNEQPQSAGHHPIILPRAAGCRYGLRDEFLRRRVSAN